MPKITVDEGFDKGESDNLPKLDAVSLFSFLGQNPDFIGAEMRGFNAVRSGRENYMDNAKGHVQVKRTENPEHNVRKKLYTVVVVCDSNYPCVSFDKQITALSASLIKVFYKE